MTQIDATTADVLGLVFAEHVIAGRIARDLVALGCITHTMRQAVSPAGGVTMDVTVVSAPETSDGPPDGGSPLPRVVVGHADGEFATAMLACGADAYLLASLGSDRLARAIFLLFAGSA